MATVLLSHERLLRFAFYSVCFAVAAMSEALTPRRRAAYARRLRWPHNLGLLALSTLLLSVLSSLGALAAAGFAERRAWGLLRVVPLPLLFRFLAAIVVLDLAIYLQHRLFHALPFFWRIHRVHHADVDCDVTTATRFHPIEMLLSTGIQMLMALVLGAPVLSVLVFEVLLNATSLFNHANVRLPASVDAALRGLIVTPDMHRVHHSTAPPETNGNYGFSLPWWDYLFGTYRAQPGAGHLAMTIGLAQFRTARDLRLDRMLAQPFTGRPPAEPALAAFPAPHRARSKRLTGTAKGHWS
jgi:sterol desaturase/sphingolipid hydroxylase (fatty acid hydroxylase superfamily)